MATKQQLAAWIGLSIPGMNLRGSIGRIISKAITEGWSQNQLLLAIYASGAFKARFPGIRGPGGELLMSPREYLAREDALRNTMKDFGLSWFWYNKPSDFAGYIKRGIEPQELERRLELSQQLLRNNPEIIKTLQGLWGISAKDARYGAIGWLMNPNKGTQQFEQYITAAQIKLAADKAGFNTSPVNQGGGFGDIASRRQFFLGLAGRGITGEQANQIFAQAAGDWAQFKTLSARYSQGQGTTDKTYAAALFSPNPALDALRKNLVLQEQAQFRKTSAFQATTGRGMRSLETDEALDR